MTKKIISISDNLINFKKILSSRSLVIEREWNSKQKDDKPSVKKKRIF